MLARLSITLMFALLSATANPAELAFDADSAPPPPMPEGEFRADVDPRGWWIGPEI